MLNISGIDEGYVIDHIHAGMCMKIYQALNLDKCSGEVAIIKNAKSRKQGKKDIIKIEGLLDIDLDLLGFMDDNITVNIIKGGRIVEKKKLSLPDRVVDVAVCKNPRCITSIEQGLEQVFILTDRENRVYRCMYCEEQMQVGKRKKIRL